MRYSNIFQQGLLVLAVTFSITLIWFSLLLGPAFGQTNVVGNFQFQPAISDDAADYTSLEIFGHVGSNVAFAGFVDLDANGNRTFSRVFADIGANGTDIGPFRNIKPTAMYVDLAGLGIEGYALGLHSDVTIPVLKPDVAKVRLLARTEDFGDTTYHLSTVVIKRGEVAGVPLYFESLSHHYGAHSGHVAVNKTLTTVLWEADKTFGWNVPIGVGVTHFWANPHGGKDISNLNAEIRIGFAF